MSQTFFNYQSAIRSAELSRAISIPKGIGPFLGYGSGITKYKDRWYIKLYPQYYGAGENEGGTLDSNTQDIKVDGYRNSPHSYISPLMRDIVKYHNILMGGRVINAQGTFSDDTENPARFGLITKDGFVVLDNTTEPIDVPILNAQTFTSSNAPAEVVVVARHKYIPEAVVNEVTYEGYALTSAGTDKNTASRGTDTGYTDMNTFYQLFRTSMDIYYNRPTAVPNFGLDNILSQNNTFGLKLSYYDLLRYINSLMANSGVSFDINDPDITLVGIYGRGGYTDTDPNTGESLSRQEQFSIVPYGGKWPYDLPFNISVLNSIAKSFNYVQGLMEGFPYTFPNAEDDSQKNLNIKDYIDKKFEELQKENNSQISSVIPSGIICLWSNENDIPQGWSVFDKAIGRVVIGFSSGTTLTMGTGSTVINQIGGTYLDNADSSWKITLKGTDLPAHHHAIALAGINNKNEAKNDPVAASWSKFTTSLDADTMSFKDNIGISNGAIVSGPNLTVESDQGYAPSQNQTAREISLNKAFPVIALVYIIKD